MQDRTRLNNGPHKLAVLRRMALNVMPKDTTEGCRGKFRALAGIPLPRLF
jgi:hypothetical protein